MRSRSTGLAGWCPPPRSCAPTPRGWNSTRSASTLSSAYTLIHLPQHAQQLLLRRIAGWLRTGSWLLATTGADAWTGVEDDWLGGGAPMWWSHPDAATYRGWLADAGLIVDSEDYVPEGHSGHQLFWARSKGQGLPQ